MHRRVKRGVRALTLILILAAVGVIITACGALTSSELADKVLEARSYYCEYRIESVRSEKEFFVKEWFRLPHQLYQEVYYQNKLLQQVWVNEGRTCIKHADLQDHFVFGQQIQPMLLRVYQEITAQDSLEAVENGWVLQVRLPSGSRAELRCSRRGLPQQVIEYAANGKLLRKYTFVNFDLNVPFKQEQPPSL